MQSVYIERCKDAPHCLTIVFEETIDKSDIENAFAKLKRELDLEHEPQNVIVVLNGRVNFPVSITTLSALPVHKHPNLKSWLVIGKNNALARVISNVLSSFTQDNKIQWFQSADDIRKYLIQDRPVAG